MSQACSRQHFQNDTFQSLFSVITVYTISQVSIYLMYRLVIWKEQMPEGL